MGTQIQNTVVRTVSKIFIEFEFKRTLDDT